MDDIGDIGDADAMRDLLDLGDLGGALAVFSTFGVPDLGKPLNPFQGYRAAHVYLRAYDVCIWNPAPLLWPHDLDRVNRLIAARYEQLPPGGQYSETGRLLTILHGQMSEVLSLALLTSTGERHRERWAHPVDVTRAKAIPVALAFYTPHNMEGQSDEAWAMYTRSAERLPPPAFGERALVWHDSNGWQVRSIEQLGQDARDMQEQMAAKLRELVAPSDWYVWSAELDACHIPGEYQRMRDDLRSELLRKRGKEREQVRASLMRLDSARNQALALEALRDRQQREGKQWTDGVLEVIVMARTLAAHYWLAEQKAQQQASKRNLPTIPNVFDNDELAEIATAMPVHAVLSGYSAAQREGPGGWVPDDAGYPTYRQVKPEHDTILQVRGEDSEQVLDEAGIQRLWAQVREYSDLDGDVFLTMLGQSLMAPDDPNGVWITGSQILDYRGVQPKTTRDENGRPRRAGHRQEDLLEIARCVGRQANQWIQINSLIADEVTAPKRGKPQKKRFTRNSKLTVILEDIRQHELTPEIDGNPAPALPIAWRYRMGTWLAPFLSENNRMVGWLCQQALRYDPYHEMWEKRLTRYFLFHLRINAAGGAATITRHVGKLIDELALPVDERHPQRTRERFEQAMGRIVADGMIDGWEYAKENPGLPPRGWLADWRGWKIAIRAAALTQERHAQIAARAQSRRERAAALDAARAKRGKGGNDAQEG